MSRLLPVALVLLAPVAAQAADGATQLWEVANLVLLIGVLIYVARKPVMEFLGTRREEIQTNIASSEKLLTDAEGRLEEWNQKVAQLDEEAQTIRDSTKRAAEQERDAIIADAKKTAERIRNSASSVVDRELRSARESLRAEVAGLATEMAGGILAEKVNDGDRDRLVDEFIEKLEQGGTH